MNDKLREMLTRHEGLRLFPYEDTVGKLTIGIGRNLTDRGISQDEVNYLFMNDVDIATLELQKSFPGFNGWSENRKNALTDMAFNIGVPRLLGFKKMVAAIKANDWATASKEMLDSLWAQQVPSRAKELAKLVEQG